MTNPPPREPRAVAAILSVARDVLDATGYRRFSVETVAERAGVDPELISGQWWRGKDDLLIDVLAEAMAVEEVPDVGDSRHELWLALAGMIGSYTDRETFERHLLAFLADRPDAAVHRELRQRCIERSRGQVGAALRRAAARGDLPPDIDTDVVHDVWAGAIAYRRLVGESHLGLADSLIDMILSGMAPLRGPDRSTPPEPDPLWWTTCVNWLHTISFGRVFPVDRVPTLALAMAPATVEFAGHPVTVSAGVTRDQMTIGGAGVSVGVTVNAVNKWMLPRFLRAERIVVLHREQVRVAPLVEAPESRTSRQFSAGAGDGPRWEPGTRVDIVVQLRGRGGVRKFVRIPAQTIGETI